MKDANSNKRMEEDKAVFSFEDVKGYFEECGANLEEELIRQYKNLFNMLAIITGGKLSKNDILDGYAVLRNTMTGHRPEVIGEIPEESVIRALTRYMEVFDEFRGKLDRHEKLRFVFCVEYSTYYGLEEFADPEQIEKLYQEDRRKNELRYWVPENYLIYRPRSLNPKSEDLRKLANAIMGGNVQKLLDRLAENCEYISERIGLELKGKEAIGAHFDKVRQNQADIYFCYKALITEADEELEFADRQECMAMAFVEEHNFISLAFIDYDEDGLITRIKQVKAKGYQFRYIDHLNREWRWDYGSKENPIMVTDVSTEYFYLDNLAYMGRPVCYRRQGSVVGLFVNPLDEYLIYRTPEDMEAGKKPVKTLYIYGYGKGNDTHPPRLFQFRSDEYVSAVTRLDAFVPDLDEFVPDLDEIEDE